MARIDFLISNNRHHVDMFEPVVRVLAGQGYRCRFVSLCEFRGMATPTERLTRDGGEVRALTRQVRGSPSSGDQLGGANSLKRRMARHAGWLGLLRGRGERWLGEEIRVVALPNDAAFPYDRIVRELKRRRIPFVLVQEGIRFPLPAEKAGGVYGLGGADAIAAWGESSGAHFRAVGVSPERICLTGNPRFDRIAATNWREIARGTLPEHLMRGTNLLFLSNPIDAQGFCTSREKEELVRRFVCGAVPMLVDSELHLIFKLHPSEDPQPFRAIVEEAGIAARATVLQDTALYPLLGISRAAVVMASTAGLEALLFGLALGVVKLPGTGYVFDYVQGGAAEGLDAEAGMQAGLERMLDGTAGNRDRGEAFLSKTLTVRGGAGEQVAELILKAGKL